MTMLKKQIKRCALLLVLLSGLLPAFAQEDYAQVANKRANKIVAVLQLPDTAKASRVRDIISLQYRNLNGIHTERDAQIKAVKEQQGTEDAQSARIKTIKGEADAKVSKLHDAYLSQLSRELSPQQIEQVKDGMTYGVLPITYKGYLEMLPDLTASQKAQILAWLTEAREHAMDGGSSEEKHWWFGKYKGKINNYLSAAGIDMKQAQADWAKRRKASK